MQGPSSPLEATLQATTTLLVSSPADRLARAVSILGAPPMMSLPMAMLAAWHSVESSEAVLSGAVTLVATTAVLPMLFVLAAYRLGFVTSPDLPRRSERLQPALFAVVCAIFAYPLLLNVDAPPAFLRLDAALASQLLLLAIVTFWWKISYHAASAAGLVLVAFAWDGATLALVFASVALLIGWARIRLKRHTPAQVLAGWASALPALWWVWPGS